jgi:hypothetical protein
MTVTGIIIIHCDSFVRVDKGAAEAVAQGSV